MHSLVRKVKTCNISSLLDYRERAEVVKIPRKHQEAIAWLVEYLKLISPSVCMHNILTEENVKTSIEH